jgi:hypothetical protein
MAQRYATGLTVPEVEAEGAVPIEGTISGLRSDIGGKCAALLQRARVINAAAHGHGAFRLRFWESRIASINEARAATFSIHELRQLRRQCQTLSLELEEFSKGLR